MLEITFTLSQHDDGYRVADWFDGGHLTIEEAEDASTIEDADRILREHYFGPDVDGVEVTWKISTASRRRRQWHICPACHGEGSCVNPNIDDRGLTAEDFADDPDFEADYFDGVYDIRCPACEGSGKVTDRQIERLRDAADDRRLAAREDGDFDRYCGAGDYRHGY